MYSWAIRWLHIAQVCHGVLCLQCDKTKNEPSYQLWVPKAPIYGQRSMRTPIHLGLSDQSHVVIWILTMAASC